MVALGIQSVVVYRQRHMRIRRGESEDLKKLIFPGFTMRDFDRSFLGGIKFIMDYWFFKFGLECSMILMGIDAWVRMDFLGAVMCIWLAFFALSKRYSPTRSFPSPPFQIRLPEYVADLRAVPVHHPAHPVRPLRWSAPGELCRWVICLYCTTL